MRVLILLVLLVGCKSQKFSTPMKLGNKWVSSEVLNQGHDIYMNNCMACHGVNGDGKGPAAQRFSFHFQEISNKEFLNLQTLLKATFLETKI